MLIIIVSLAIIIGAYGHVMVPRAIGTIGHATRGHGGPIATGATLVGILLLSIGGTAQASPLEPMPSTDYAGVVATILNAQNNGMPDYHEFADAIGSWDTTQACEVWEDLSGSCRLDLDTVSLFDPDEHGRVHIHVVPCGMDIDDRWLDCHPKHGGYVAGQTRDYPESNDRPARGMAWLVLAPALFAIARSDNDEMPTLFNPWAIGDAIDTLADECADAEEWLFETASFARERALNDDDESAAMDHCRLSAIIDELERAREHGRWAMTTDYASWFRGTQEEALAHARETRRAALEGMVDALRAIPAPDGTYSCYPVDVDELDDHGADPEYVEYARDLLAG